MDLESIPGIGEKTAAALSELDDPETAIETGDVATLASVPDVSEGRAARIARAAIRRRHDDPGGFLATDRAREIYREVLGLLTERAVTTYAEKRLTTFYPSPTRSRIEEAREFVESAMARDPDPTALEALEDVTPLSAPDGVAVRDRCLATADAEAYGAAREAFPELSVEIVEDARTLSDLARGYSTVIALDETFTGVALDGDVRVEPDALSRPVEIVPERTLSFFAANRDPIRAAIAVHRAAALDSSGDLDGLEGALDRLDEDGQPIGDDELDRLTRAVDDLDAVVATAEAIATDRLREAIRERDVTIEGADLLSLVERGAGVDSLLSRELADEHAAAIEAAREHLAETLALDPGEEELARQAFSEEPTFPVEAEGSVVSRLREDLTAARDRQAARGKRELAAALSDRREDAERLVRSALDLDVELAIARFAADYDGALPEFSGEGIEIEGGRSPLLSEPADEIEPVDYAVSGVTLLSGVNSGGKTSTLDLLAAVTILAHMGLPVPAERVRLQRFDALHYHAKTQGTLDAGAFESTLREFGAIVEGSGRRLVLVDELESITEPGASAKIVAGILEELAAGAATAVFVSHLAAQIRESASVPIVVDGIRAKGLEAGELVVDRSPVKDHLARSTPELIVEKLADESDGEFYGRLLEKFE